MLVQSASIDTAEIYLKLFQIHLGLCRANYRNILWAGYKEWVIQGRLD